jgi:hypothetical protein
VSSCSLRLRALPGSNRKVIWNPRLEEVKRPAGKKFLGDWFGGLHACTMDLSRSKWNKRQSSMPIAAATTEKQKNRKPHSYSLCSTILIVDLNISKQKMYLHSSKSAIRIMEIGGSRIYPGCS